MFRTWIGPAQSLDEYNKLLEMLKKPKKKQKHEKKKYQA